MKKKGFTLVEIIVVLSIVFILVSISIKGIGIYSKLVSESEIENYLVTLKNKFIYYKEFCISNKTNITFSILSNGDIEVKDKSYSIVEVIRREENLQIVFGTGESQTNTRTYYIDETSKIHQSGTLGFKDIYSNKYKLTISPGDEVIRIYSKYDASNPKEFK